MNLKEFTQQVIRDVTQAVEEVRSSSKRDMRLGANNDNRTIEFDIAVTVEEGTGKQGGANIQVLQLLKVGGDVSNELKNSTVSRVKFGVNIDEITREEEAALRQAQESYNSQFDEGGLI